MHYRIIALLLLILPLFMTAAGQKAPKKVKLTGNVTDSNQRPVQGALILIDNVKTSCVTDAKGNYTLKIKSSAKTVAVFTMFNGAVNEEMINGRTVVNFRIAGSEAGGTSSQNKQKDEVNIGYGTVGKNDLTTPVGSIDGQNPKYLSYSNIYDMIRGEVPGVQVSGQSITIQGPTSINFNGPPLFVVDGIVVESIDDLRPHQVRSIQILKGSSASIYGSRGANGVILITLVGAGDKK